MTSHPTVSVVIATYNYGEFLAAAIDSVIEQSFQDLEIVIVDDGSNDGTPDVVRPYLDNIRVRYIRTEHLGQPAAKNAGIRAASGEFVAFLDADDLWLPSKLEKQVALLRSDERLGVVHTGVQPMNQFGQLVTIHEERPRYRGWVLEQIFHRPFVCFSSSMIRRSVLDAVGWFDEGIPLAIDYDLWLRVALKYRFDHLDERLVLYRSGHANLSRRMVERSRCVRIIMQRFLMEFGGRERLGKQIRKTVWAEHCCDTAMAYGKRNPLRAIGWYSRALASSPCYRPAWKSLASFWWPDRLRRCVLRYLRRPDWRQIQVTPLDRT
jgi:glycosyltransferase involved in cell wall biosynthesis